MRRFAALLFCSAVVLCTLPLSAKKGEHPSAFYVFGDSFVDNGNVLIASRQLGFAVPLPPSSSPHETYFEGRFSNGPVAFEYLWQQLEHRKPGAKKALKPYLENPCVSGAPIRSAVDFAFGASGTGVSTLTPSGVAVPGLLGQVGLFACALQGHAAPSDALYAIWSGANDYLNHISSAPLEPPLDPTTVVANIVESIQGLYGLGARRIVVLNYADLGKGPAVIGTPAGALLTELTRQHNAALAVALSRLEPLLPGLELSAIDVSGFFDSLPRGSITRVPALDTLFPPPGPGQIPMSLCILVDPEACQDVPTFDVSRRYVFWDVEHPTTEMHRLVAEQIYETIVGAESLEQ